MTSGSYGQITWATTRCLEGSQYAVDSQGSEKSRSEGFPSYFKLTFPQPVWSQTPFPSMPWVVLWETPVWTVSPSKAGLGGGRALCRESGLSLSF